MSAKNLKDYKYKIRYIEAHIVDSCNLNCDGCTHNSHFIKNDVFVDANQFIEDIYYLSDNLYIQRIKIFGGEPLLHPQISEILRETRKAYPHSFISILTNGILLPSMNEDFWQTLRNSNIAIELSKYPIMDKKFVDILNLIDDKGVQTGVLFLRNKFYDNLNLKGDSNIDIAYKNCGCKHCTTLWNRKIYPCAACYREYYNKAFNTSIVIPEGYDIYTVPFDETISKVYSPIEACRYCKEIPTPHPWKQYKGKKFFVDKNGEIKLSL